MKKNSIKTTKWLARALWQSSDIEGSCHLQLSDEEQSGLKIRRFKIKAAAHRLSEIIEQKDSIFSKAYYEDKIMPECWYVLISNEAEMYFSFWRLIQESNHLLKKKVEQLKIDFSYRSARELFELAILKPISDDLTAINISNLEEPLPYGKLHRRLRNDQEIHDIAFAMLQPDADRTLKAQLSISKRLETLLRKNHSIDRSLGRYELCSSSEIDLERFILSTCAEYSEKRPGNQVLRQLLQDHLKALSRLNKAEADMQEKSGRRLKQWEKALSSNQKNREKWKIFLNTIMIQKP